MKLTITLRYKNVHSAKRLFQPFITSPAKSDSTSKVTSRSQKLMHAAGIIHQAHNGLFHLLPLGIRALKKLTALVEDCISKQLNAQQISVPSLTDAQLWNKTGRKEVAGVELFTLTDRHKKQFVLAPTHEESIANLIATIPLISHRDLPLLLYQITNKYRDEMRPRFGLIRSKEFLMKDLYSFDKSKEDAIDTYAKVCNTYEIILNRIGVDYVKVVGDTGLMGGSFSHEYHYIADIGDDTLSICSKCHSSWNSDIHKDEGSKKEEVCHECGSTTIRQHKGIEVGHAFLLGTKYSTALNALFNSDKQKREHLVMGSYGLGLTRMIAAAVEVLSTPNEIRWPAVFTPYSVVIITPKEGSKEAAMVDNLGIDLYTTLQTIKGLNDDILLDDRTHLTIGRRLTEAKLTGYPNIIVIGKSAATLQPPHYELHNLYNDTIIEITFDELIEQIKRNCNFEITNDNCLSHNLLKDVIVV